MASIPTTDNQRDRNGAQRSESGAPAGALPLSDEVIAGTRRHHPAGSSSADHAVPRYSS